MAGVKRGMRERRSDDEGEEREGRADYDEPVEKKKKTQSSPPSQPPIIIIGNSPLETHKLYFTKIEGLPARFNENAFNLDEILDSIKPVSSLHFNFMIDTRWVMSQYPSRCRNTPMTIVVGEKMGTGVREIRSEAESEGWTNINVQTASLPIPFGTHHSKLSIFEDDDMTIHILISTANLLPCDWKAKTQMFYYMKSAKVNRLDINGRRVEKEVPIVMDLIEYLGRYPIEGMTYWKDRLRESFFDFTVNRIVFSVPGYHKGEEMHKVGHKSVRNILRESRATDQNARKTLICQSSSIGSLGGTAGGWLGGEFTLSMRGGRDTTATQCWMIYPTKSDVMESVGGKLSGGSLPYSKGTAEKQEWLLKNMCRWRADNWGRSRIMPHVKSYLQADPNTRRFDWQIVTSANLSKAAWGTLQKNGGQLMIRSFEIGVLIMDPHCIRVPFDYPLARYKGGDRPWYIEDLDDDDQ
ncbi:hypothetical protein PENTCL1PPCAC_18331 [Pristionchus entomophagus]|uniref:Tyrosyl-DNA phosphodiesterase n=1 Tax=Pristionchus entomophagus TaxID=358040 RepID=A0AAV5TPB6_9BILA|nr:hypothetical protein PENTCL1PPCAC_18331 [Pristionchus entomophagus]